MLYQGIDAERARPKVNGRCKTAHGRMNYARERKSGSIGRGILPAG